MVDEFIESLRCSTGIQQELDVTYVSPSILFMNPFC